MSFSARCLLIFPELLSSEFSWAISHLTLHMRPSSLAPWKRWSCLLIMAMFGYTVMNTFCEELDELRNSAICFQTQHPPPPPILKTHVWSLKLRVENVMNRCFIILYKHRGWIKPPELVSLTIWGRFLLQRGRFSTKCQHQNTATVMGFRSRRNLQDGEVYWHYKWWWFLSLTPRAYKHSVLSRGAVSEMSDAPEASQCVLLMLMPPWQWLQKSPKDRLKTTCKVSALVAGY